ncbi:MAG: translation initiation factor IF-2 [Lachnospiraceae bacterium]|nr:translation initiation factor IF-2 [Lachnospiraceae bacterium]
MAKIKVHELAKEVGADRKAVVEYLRAKGYETITAVSLVPDGEVENVRSRFGPGKTGGASDFSGAFAVKKEGAAAEEGQKKKGKGIVRVFRAQNANGSLQKKPKTESETGADIKTESGNVDKKTEVAGADSAKTDAVKDTVPVTETKAPAEKAPQNQKPRQAEDALKTSAPKKEETVKAADQKESTKPADNRTAGTGNTAGGQKPVQRDGSSQSGSRPQGDRRQGNRDGQGGERRQGVRDGQGGERRQGSRDGQSGERRPYNRDGQSGERRPYNRDGQSGDRRQGSRDGQGGERRQGSRDGQSGERRPFSRDGQSRPAGTRQGSRDSQGERRPFGRDGQGSQGRSSFGQGGQRKSSPVPAGDGALAHKTSRDHRKDNSKEYDRNREERRENGKHSQFGSRPNQSKKQFNRIPKALQQNQPKNEQPKVKEVVTEIKIPEKITIRELAEAMKMAPTALVKDLFMKGQMVTVNHEVPFEKAQEIAMEYDIIAEQEEKEDVIGALLAEDEEEEKDMVPRPPVVCVMGHVDHGKTSLLDAIRNTHVTDREAGGITQHIGAYMVTVHGQKITFLDTPGHEAFTAMRMRGANSTDIAVLVVAADDGVMPQTVEAINHAKAAKVDIIVAINKIDKPGANIERVKQELSEYELVPEEWGGQTIFCPVSAKTQEGIENLLEMILLTAEMAELKANPNRKARGLVLEAKLDKGRGPVATILVQKGTLKQGDFIACGSAHGKVRAMTDEKGKRLTKAKPSMPVEIIGLSSVPDAGEVLVALNSDKEAKAFAQTFVTEGKKTLIEETKTQMSLDDLFNQIQEGKLKELPIVVKADVQGSVEAVKQSLLKLSNDEVVVKVIHGGVGNINESDVSLAAASNAIIIGFNVRPDATAKQMAETQKVDVHLYNVIYEALEDVERALNGMRAAVYEEKVLGHAEIRQIFKASGVGNIAGAYVKDGIFQRNCSVRVFRGEEKLYEGSLASLKRFKDDVKEVREGYECGLVFKDFGDFEIDDTVEAYTMVEVPRT